MAHASWKSQPLGCKQCHSFPSTLSDILPSFLYKTLQSEFGFDLVGMESSGSTVLVTNPSALPSDSSYKVFAHAAIPCAWIQTPVFQSRDLQFVVKVSHAMNLRDLSKERKSPLQANLRQPSVCKHKKFAVLL